MTYIGKTKRTAKRGLLIQASAVCSSRNEALGKFGEQKLELHGSFVLSKLSGCFISLHISARSRLNQLLILALEENLL